MKDFARIMALSLLAVVEHPASAGGGVVAAQVSAASGIAALSKARAASGGAAWNSIKGLHGEGQIEVSRLPGTWSRGESRRRGISHCRRLRRQRALAAGSVGRRASPQRCLFNAGKRDRGVVDTAGMASTGRRTRADRPRIDANGR